MSLMAVALISEARYLSMDHMTRFFSRVPWSFINKAISASLDPGSYVLLPVPSVQSIYEWLNPKTSFSDLQEGISCYVVRQNDQGFYHPTKTVRMEDLKLEDFEIFDPESGQEWINNSPVNSSTDVEFVDHLQGRFGMQEVIIKRFNNTKLRYIQREARVVGIASSLGVSPHFLGLLEATDLTWDNPAIVMTHSYHAIPLHTYIQCTPLLSRYQVFELCRRIVKVLRCLHDEQIMLNDFKISHLAAVGDPNPSLHPLDPHIIICDLSEATFMHGTRYHIPRSARHLHTHCAPEVLSGRVTSHSSDIYSLGKVLSDVMNTYDVTVQMYLLVAWCCNKKATVRPQVEQVYTYLRMLQDLQKKNCDQPIDSMDVSDVDLSVKKIDCGA